MGLFKHIRHAFKRLTHHVEKNVKKTLNTVGKGVGAVLGVRSASASSSSDSGSYAVAAPTVEAPEPTSGQEEEDLVSKKRRQSNKGKRSLMISSGGLGGGGSTGTGLNL